MVKKSIPQQRLQRYFSPLLITFIGVVILLVVAVVYVAFSKTTIAITLKDVPEQIPFQYTASELAVEPNTEIINHTYAFTDYESTAHEDAIARGTVTLVNNYSVTQPLVRTTRLLSTEGELFHTDETTTVPAGGTVDVPVYADVAGANGNIPASQFEIVALSSELKSKIYATSTTAMTGGVIQRAVLTAELIEQAKTAAKQAALADIIQVDLDATSQAVNGTVGDTVDNITVTTTGEVSTVPITDEEILARLLADEILIADDADLNYTISHDGSDFVIAGTVGSQTTVHNLDFVTTANLTNKTAQQVIEYLKGFDQVETAEVHFVPFWVERTPKLPQQINLLLAN